MLDSAFIYFCDSCAALLNEGRTKMVVLGLLLLLLALERFELLLEESFCGA